MAKRYALSLFVFRRDLRLSDNRGLQEAVTQSDQVVPAFILDPRQLENNPYRSYHALQFMARSLQELDAALRRRQGRLIVLEGVADRVIGRLLADLPIEAVFLNQDYTPFSLERDKAIARVCSAHGRPFHSCHDLLLNQPNAVLKPDHTPYTVFTPFHRRAQRTIPPEPQPLSRTAFFSGAIANERGEAINRLLIRANPDLAVTGGRSKAKAILSHLDRFSAYARERDIPAKAATTGLSAHLKFGTISAREAYTAIAATLGPDHPLIRQLHWRDFFTQIAFHFPQVFGQPFQKQYGTIRWRTDDQAFAAWCDGRTGVPIVDAGMRQLNRTGFMHNRVRMIAASFLVKDLHVDWRLGEKYFAQQLVDYDPAVNNGNWQWAASTGCDAVPYFRIFNPWLQQKRFDPESTYIHRWVPELKDLSALEIHRLNLSPPARRITYPRPIVDHERERLVAIQMFRSGRTRKSAGGPQAGRRTRSKV